MYLLDDNKLVSEGKELLDPFMAERVTNIGYDVSCESFIKEPGTEEPKITLGPNESAFVKTSEIMKLPDDMIAYVQLRNSRIRQGLTLDAPIYQPGHNTKVFFRITNVSKGDISLSSSDELATVIFIQLDKAVKTPYSGTFSNEMNYEGMGDYSSNYSEQISKVDKKINNLEKLERNIYANVLAIMAVFVGVFSLININVSLVTQNIAIKTLLVTDFTMVGAIGFLIAMVSFITSSHKKIIWLPSVIAFAVALILAIVL